MTLTAFGGGCSNQLVGPVVMQVFFTPSFNYTLNLRVMHKGQPWQVPRAKWVSQSASVDANVVQWGGGGDRFAEQTG